MTRATITANRNKNIKFINSKNNSRSLTTTTTTTAKAVEAVL